MLQGKSINSFNVLASGLFPLPLVFSSPDLFLSMLCPNLMTFFKSCVFVRGAFVVIY